MASLIQSLECALNGVHPMRNISATKWIFAGSFMHDGMVFSFYAEEAEHIVTFRCMDKPGYANHWHTIEVDYNQDGTRLFKVGGVAR